MGERKTPGERRRIPGPAGDLEAVWSGTRDAAVGVAVVAHPHPLYGGTMENLVVLEAAAACERAGLAVLRFNFRGVGGSDGAHDSGRGEVDDLEAAVTEVLTGAPQRLVLVGYSFGAAMTLRALAQRRPWALDAERALVLAPPVTHYDFREVAGAGVPLGLVCGTRDDLTPARALAENHASWLGQEAMSSVGDPSLPGVLWLDGEGHDLGATGLFDSALAGALDSLLAAEL